MTGYRLDDPGTGPERLPEIRDGPPYQVWAGAIAPPEQSARDLFAAEGTVASLRKEAQQLQFGATQLDLAMGGSDATRVKLEAVRRAGFGPLLDRPVMRGRQALRQRFDQRPQVGTTNTLLKFTYRIVGDLRKSVGVKIMKVALRRPRAAVGRNSRSDLGFYMRTRS